VSAGLVVAMTRMALTCLAQASLPADQILSTMNDLLRDGIGQRSLGMAFSVGLLQPNHGTIDLGVMGMPAPFRFEAATGKVQRIDLKGPPLGFFRTVRPMTTTVLLNPGDALVLLSDGFDERFDPDGNQWGLTAVAAELESVVARGLSAEDIADALVASCDEFASGRPNEDDMTVLVLRRCEETTVTP
jgi:sigma-B regulation protein RsbU (phosphoserine phosphatase)